MSDCVLRSSSYQGVWEDILDRYSDYATLLKDVNPYVTEVRHNRIVKHTWSATLNAHLGLRGAWVPKQESRKASCIILYALSFINMCLYDTPEPNKDPTNHCLVGYCSTAN